MTRLSYALILLTLSLLLASCGGETPGTASATFGMTVVPPENVGKTVNAVTDVCSDYNIATVTAIVLTSSGSEVTRQSWSCSAHSGTITGIPVGSGYTFRLEGKDGVNSTTWRGDKTNVTLTQGAGNSIGSIPISYIGATTPTAAVLKLSTSGSGTIKGIQATLTLPAGVTIANSSGTPSTGKVTLSGVTSANTYLSSNVSGQTLQIVVADSTGFQAGEFITINADIASGTGIVFNNGFTLSNVIVSGANGVVLSAVNVNKLLTVQ